MSIENEIIIFDTETNGIPDWKVPSDDPIQPHIVQLAAIQVDLTTKKIIQTMDLIVKPDGWEIGEETIEIHGITNEYAAENGLPEKEVLEIFLKLWGGRKRIAYNTTFDNRIIRIASKRFLSEIEMESWKTGDYECAMAKSRKRLGGKNPKLVDAYEKVIGKEMTGAHTAMGDTLATLELYFELDNLPELKSKKAKG